MEAVQALSLDYQRRYGSAENDAEFAQWLFEEELQQLHSYVPTVSFANDWKDSMMSDENHWKLLRSGCILKQ